MSDMEFKNDFEEEEPIVLNLILDDGEEVSCEVIGIFEVEGAEYIALVPENDDRVLIYKYSELENDEIDLQNIEDDAEFEKVTEAFWEVFGDEDFERERRITESDDIRSNEKEPERVPFFMPAIISVKIFIFGTIFFTYEELRNRIKKMTEYFKILETE